MTLVTFQRSEQLGFGSLKSRLAWASSVGVNDKKTASFFLNACKDTDLLRPADGTVTPYHWELAPFTLAS